MHLFQVEVFKLSVVRRKLKVYQILGQTQWAPEKLSSKRRLNYRESKRCV